jgi:hypothetical protein
MTKKDHALIARVLADAPAVEGVDAHSVYVVTQLMAAALRVDNPNFDRLKFLQAAKP